MAGAKPLVIVRLGSHAEKEYVLKLAPFLDGVIVGANLFEATPGATASLLLKAGTRARIYVDPMTYAFGAYVDPGTGAVRTDLDWIKSDQKISRGKGVKDEIVRDFKRSYKALAVSFGSPVSEAVGGSRAISAKAFEDPEGAAAFCKNVVEYQLTRIRRECEEETELRDWAEHVPGPTAVFAPYFYNEPSNSAPWLGANLALARASSGLGGGRPVHAVVCADVAHLADSAFVKRLQRELPKTGVSGAWLWFSGFYEEAASAAQLAAYKELVVELSKELEVFAMHGGLLGLALSKHGMRGVSHGVGYGEQKDVVPVIGQSTPTVRYYLPPLGRRLGVPQIERAFDGLGIRTAEDFHEKVCDCAVCRGVVEVSPAQFSAFGEMRLSRPAAKRSAQTPAAAKRCRFHFLLSRIRERDAVADSSVDDLVKRFVDAAGSWGAQPSLCAASSHLARWAEVLGTERVMHEGA